MHIRERITRASEALQLRGAEGERGSISRPIMVLFGGVLFMVFGLVLSSTILSQAASSGGDANIGSFSGTQSLNDLLPFIYYAILVVGGAALIGGGALGLAGRGPVSG